MNERIHRYDQLQRLARILGRRAARDVVRRGSGANSASEQAAASYLSATQVASHLGISLRTVRRWIRSGQLPSSRVGGTRLVAIADLEDALSVDAKSHK